MILVKDTSRNALEAVAGALDASGSNPAIEAVMRAVGVALLSQIQQDFITKARGGTGRDGIKWKPLAPATIAGRRASKEDERDVRKTILAERRRVYEEALSRMEASAANTFDGAKPRKGSAAAMRKEASEFANRWAEARGRAIRKEVLSARDVEILRDTGLMFRSFTPGVAGVESAESAESQVFVVSGATVTVGSSEKPWHQHGGPSLPQREIWPSDGVIPAAWWPPMVLAAQLALRQSLGAKRL